MKFISQIAKGEHRLGEELCHAYTKHSHVWKWIIWWRDIP